MDTFIDEVAVERALKGERVPLTPAERAEIVRRIKAKGLGKHHLMKALRVNGTKAKQLMEAA